MKKILIFLAFLFLMVSCKKEHQNETIQSEIQTKDSVKIEVPKSSVTHENTDGDVSDQYVYLEKVYQKDGKWFADADYIQFLTGEKGLEEAKKRGLAEKEIDEKGKEHYFLLDDYIIINDNTQVRTFEIDPTAKIYSYNFKDGSAISNEAPKTNITALSATREDHYPYTINVSKGKITEIKQIYVP